MKVLKPSSKALLPVISNKLYKWNKTETDYVLLNPEEDETVIFEKHFRIFQSIRN